MTNPYPINWPVIPHRCVRIVERERLPNRRASVGITFDVGPVRYHAHVSCFPDGRLAEIFLEAGKPGTPVQAVARDLAVCMSIALQHGCPVETLQEALTVHSDGTPAGPLGVLLGILSGCDQ